MKDEIKEILDKLKSNNYPFGIATIDIDKLLYYITNLQTIEQQYSAILSENAELENKITNLQKENERLKEENKRIFSKVNDDELLISNAMNYAEAQDYKQRNEKAVDYIIDNCVLSDEWKDLSFCNFIPTGRIKYKQLSKTKIKHLLNILRGGNKWKK